MTQTALPPPEVAQTASQAVPPEDPPEAQSLDEAPQIPQSDNPPQRPPSDPAHDLLFIRPEEFADPGFDAEAFVLARLHVPSDDLVKELGTHLRHVRATLVDVVNGEYTHFVSLTKNLLGVDVLVGELQGPTAALRARAEGVRAQFDGMARALQGRFETRNSLRQRKQLLQLQLDMIASADKLEALLPAAGAPLTEQAVERLGIEYNQLQFLLSRRTDLALVGALEPRVQRIRESLHAGLAAALAGVLAQAVRDPAGADTALTLYLRGYAVLDQMADALVVFRYTLVAPFVEELLSPAAAQALVQLCVPGSTAIKRVRGAAVGPEHPPRSLLTTLYDRLIDWLVGPAAPVVRRIRQTTAGHAPGLDPVIDVVLPAFVTRLIQSAGQLFVPTTPDSFHRNYLATVRFLVRLEAETLPTRALATAFRSSQACVELLRRWQTGIYAQMRFNEIAAQFEDALPAPALSGQGQLPETAADGRHVLVLPASHELLNSLRLCWAEDVVLPVLAGRFWKLSLQLVARYTLWMRSSVEACVAADSMPVPAGEADDDAKIQQCASLVNDARTLTERLPELFARLILPRLPAELCANESERLLVEQALAEAVAPLGAAGGAGNVAISVLTRRCAEPLRAVRDIPGQYRRTNRDPPTAASAYVAASLAPLRAFRAAPFAAPLRGKVADEWTLAVANAVAAKFAALLTDMLVALKKTEESLQRLKRVKRPTLSGVASAAVASAAVSRGSDSPAPAAAKDEDKVRLQAYLDVTAFGAGLGHLGVSLGDCAPWGDLLAVVAPYNPASMPQFSSQVGGGAMDSSQEGSVS